MADLIDIENGDSGLVARTKINDIGAAVNGLIDRTSISISDFGAVPAAGVDNYTAIQGAIDEAIASGYAEVKAPAGIFETSQKIQCKSSYLSINFEGALSAHSSFTDDFLFSIESGGQSEEYTPQFYHPVTTHNLVLKCNFLTRGIYAYNIDHASLNNVRVENSNGSAFRLDRLRESTLYMPAAINCAHREAYLDTDLTGDWDNSTAWVQGNTVRYRPDNYAAGTTYPAGEVVLDGGFNWISAENGNLGNAPLVTSQFWRKVPHQDYLCLLDNSGKSPLDFNTNDSDELNHFWKKIYQDEALFDVVDDVYIDGDRQNQVTFYSPICRDSDNKCLFRIDNNRNSSSNTHINIYSGHLHQVGINALGEYAEITGQEDTRCLELGRTINCNIHGTNIFSSDRPQGISLLVGDLGSKTSASVKIQAAIASDGDNQTGIIVMPSVVGSDLNIIDPSYVVNSVTNHVKLVDAVRFTRRYMESEQVIRMPDGRVATPTGLTVVGAGDYPLTRFASLQKSGDSSDRIRMESTAGGTSRVGFGDGVSTPDSYLERKGSNRLGTGSGDTWQIDATYTAPFRMGTAYVWTDSNIVYIKSSAPSNATDGTVWIDYN